MTKGESFPKRYVEGRGWRRWTQGHQEYIRKREMKNKIQEKRGIKILRHTSRGCKLMNT
jgi:hypothetical protein